MIISSLFNIEIAKSKGIEDYESGKIPFVTSSSLNNGVVKYVDPYEDDRVFNGNTICVSGLGHATCQLFSYLPKGNGGDSATILIPKEEMSVEELIFTPLYLIFFMNGDFLLVGKQVKIELNL